MGDHIQLLQIYDQWHRTRYDIDWCEQHGLQVRSMVFARDVRKQLSGIMQKSTKGFSQDKIEDANLTSLRKALCIGFANRLAQRMPRHNGYRTFGATSRLVQIHPSACSMEVDEEGLLPEWIVYNELISTGRPYIRHVCAVEGSWCQPALIKLKNMCLNRLSGCSSNNDHSTQTEILKQLEGLHDPQIKDTQDVHDDAVAAARKRFLARKQSRTQNAGK